jgi:hypothetical protein
MPRSIIAVFAYGANTATTHRGQRELQMKFAAYFISFSPFLLFNVSYNKGVAINNEE